MLRRALLSLCACLFGIASLATVSDDYAPSDLSAPAILKHATAAEGGLAPGAYVILAHSHGGGEDDTFVTHQDGDDYRTVDTSGPFITSYGSYHGQSWTQDENGTVLLQSDFVAKTDPNILALEHPDDPKYNVKAFGITRAADPQYVVEVNPPGGSDQFRYYDLKTMLLTQTVTFSKDRHKHVFTYSDYRTAFGETRAYHTHYSDGRSDNDTDTWTTSIAADSSPEPLAIPTSRPLYTFPNDAPVSLPARFTRAGIIVRVTIAGRGLDFALDSGASNIALDRQVARDAGILPYGQTTGTDGGEVEESRSHVPEMRVGPLILTNVEAALVPLSFESSDARIVGLLGCDFIAGSIVGIDFAKQTVTLYPHSFDPQKAGATWHHSIDVDDCIPRISGSIEGIAGNFLIDTGSNLTVLYPNYLHKLPGAYLNEDSGAMMGTVGGTLQAHRYDVADLILGPIVQRDAQVTVPATSTWDILDYDGVLGRTLLQNATIYFDYASRQVYIKLAA